MGGEDTHRECGSGCGGCHSGGEEIVPCCSGLEEVKRDGKYVCEEANLASAPSTKLAPPPPPELDGEEADLGVAPPPPPESPAAPEVEYDGDDDKHNDDNGEPACAPTGADPFGPGYDHTCCYPGWKVIGKWQGPTCSYQCFQCSQSGEDTHREC